MDIIEKDLFATHMPGVSYLRLDGGVEASKRFDVVRQFNADPTIDVLLLTTHGERARTARIWGFRGIRAFDGVPGSMTGLNGFYGSLLYSATIHRYVVQFTFMRTVFKFAFPRRKS